MKMRFLSLAAVLCLGGPALGNAQVKAQPKPKQKKQVTPAPKFIEIAPAGTEKWKPSKMKLADLAKRVATSVSKLKATSADLMVNVQTPEGQGYFVSPDFALRVLDQSHYRVDFVVIQNVPFSGSLAHDGRYRAIRLDDKVRQKLPASFIFPAVTKIQGDGLVRLFETDFPRLAFQGLTDKKDAWQPVMGGWARGVGGYKAVVEERRMRYKNHDFMNYRVLATRTADAAKIYGKCTFEVVVDAKQFLPVTIRNVRTDVKGKSWYVQWAAIYRFSQRIALKDLKLGS